MLIVTLLDTTTIYIGAPFYSFLVNENGQEGIADSGTLKSLIALEQDFIFMKYERRRHFARGEKI